MSSIEDRLNLRGKAVVVAGAGGGGIGTAICRMLAEAGVAVGAIDLGREQLVAAEQAVGAVDGRIVSLVADLREPDQVARAVGEAAAALGSLHGLVHVAGGLLNRWGSVLTTPPETFDDIVRLNLNSPFLSSQAVAARLAEQGTPGSIVHITSLAALASMPFGAAYGAAKAALIALDPNRGARVGPARHSRRTRSRAAPSGRRAATRMRPRHPTPTSSATRSRSAGAASPTTSPARCCSCCPTSPRSCPATYSWSTVRRR